MDRNLGKEPSRFTTLHLLCIVLAAALTASWALFFLMPRGVVDRGVEQVGGTYQNCNILDEGLVDYIVLDKHENRYYFYQNENPEETGTYTVDKLDAALTYGSYGSDGAFYGQLDDGFYGYKVVCTNGEDVTELVAVGDTLYRLRGGQMAPYAKTSTVTVFSNVDFSGSAGEGA